MTDVGVDVIVEILLGLDFVADDGENEGGDKDSRDGAAWIGVRRVWACARMRGKTPAKRERRTGIAFRNFVHPFASFLRCLVGGRSIKHGAEERCTHDCAIRSITSVAAFPVSSLDRQYRFVHLGYMAHRLATSFGLISLRKYPGSLTTEKVCAR